MRKPLSAYSASYSLDVRRAGVQEPAAGQQRQHQIGELPEHRNGVGNIKRRDDKEQRSQKEGLAPQRDTRIAQQSKERPHQRGQVPEQPERFPDRQSPTGNKSLHRWFFLPWRGPVAAATR